MGTFLFDQVVFGPVRSRRLGQSLGINLLPVNTKFCNFNCIYCECGATQPESMKDVSLPSYDEVKNFLEQKLKDLKKKEIPVDTLTFAGNGEPTLHPDFEHIIDITVQFRNTYFPNAQIAVLSNSTLIEQPHIFRALHHVDQNILKLDAGTEATVGLINRPVGRFHLQTVIQKLKQFEGHLIIQSLFIKGTYQGLYVDNTHPDEIQQWLEHLATIQPQLVMIYTFERDTPVGGLEKISWETLYEIAQKVEDIGIPTQVSG